MAVAGFFPRGAFPSRTGSRDAELGEIDEVSRLWVWCLCSFLVNLPEQKLTL